MSVAFAVARGRRRRGEPVNSASHALIESFDQVDAGELLETYEIDWCDGCGLPAESCCCPDSDDESEFTLEDLL